jgi:hypothetical protein
MDALTYIHRLRLKATQKPATENDAEPGFTADRTASHHAAEPCFTHVDAVDLPVKSMCRCGRYWLEAATVNEWVVNPATNRLEAAERIETLGRVTPIEMARWKLGVQSICTDIACARFEGERHPSPATVPTLDETEVVAVESPADR